MANLLDIALELSPPDLREDEPYPMGHLEPLLQLPAYLIVDRVLGFYETLQVVRVSLLFIDVQ